MSALTNYFLLSEENKRIVNDMVDKLLKVQLTEEKKVPKVYLNDEQVEKEIARLKESPYVKLGKKEEGIRIRRRRYMYKLRDLEKKGKALAATGLTLELLEAMDREALEALKAGEALEVL